MVYRDIHPRIKRQTEAASDDTSPQATSTFSAAANDKSAVSPVASQIQPTIQLVAYVLPTPPGASITAEVREYNSSDGPRCTAAALLRPAAPYHSGAAEGPIPARSVSPLLAATLAPLPSSLPQGARMAAIHAILGPSITHTTLKHVAPIARAGSYNVLGCALHAATLGACMEPHGFLSVTAAILDAGGPVDITLSCEPASARALVPIRAATVAGNSGGLGITDSTHWLTGATCLHVVALFGLQNGSAVVPLLRMLREAGTSPYALPALVSVILACRVNTCMQLYDCLACMHLEDLSTYVSHSVFCNRPVVLLSVAQCCLC